MKLKFIEEKAMKVVMLVTTLLVFLFVGSIYIPSSKTAGEP